MPTLHDGQIAIDFTGSEPRSRTTSLSGATVAVTRAGSQLARMLVRYLEHGPLTDGDQALALGLPEARISARRSMGMKRGLIASCDIVRGPHGADCVRWQLTVRGTFVAGALRSAQR